MTFKEAKEAFIHHTPVCYKGGHYKEIIRISFQFDKYGALIETATMLDMNSRTEVTVPIKEIKTWESSE